MATTAKQLIEYLQQFPDDASIFVLKEVQAAWSITTEVVEMEIDTVEVIDFRTFEYLKDTDPDKTKVEIRLVG